MKGTAIVLGQVKGRKAAAFLRDGRLEDFLIDGDGPGPGAILRGTCDRPVKGTGGMFLTLPDGGRGYMRQAKGLKPGQSLLVQISGHAEPGKALPVTPRVLFKSRYVIVTPDAPGRNVSRSIRDGQERARLGAIAEVASLPEGTGLILRSAAAFADGDVIGDDLTATSDLAAKVMADAGQGPDTLLDAPDAHLRAWINWPAADLTDDAPGAFEAHGVDGMLAALRLAQVDLGPVTAFIEPTRALVAVDVNTGADTSPAAGLKANLELARDLPRQLRCRGLGGQVTLDLAPMPKKDRRVFEQAMRKAFRDDPVETVLAGWTPLGHFELQRKRERLPVAGLI